MFPPTRPLIAAIALFGLSFVSSAEEISFNENVSERVVATNSGYAVVGGGSLEINISVPMKGPTNFTGASLLQFSIGNLSFSSALSNAVDYFNGARSFTFVQTSTNTSAGLETNRLNVSWSRSLLTISGTTHDDFVLANNFLNTTGSFHQVVFGNISFGGVEIINRPVYSNGKTTVLYKRVGSGDTAQEFALDFVQASGSADFTPPSVAVTSLVENARLASTNPIGSTNVFVFSTNIFGTASDNVAVSQVLYRLGTASPFLVASGTSNWIGSNVTPVPGTNTLYFKAVDLDENTSRLEHLKFFYAVTNRLALSTNGSGSIGGLTNLQPLEIGRGYSATAKPKTGNLFSHWSGNVTTPITALKLQSPTINFLMASNGTLQANFVPNPFPSAKGPYTGLFSQSIGVDLTSAGLLTFNLNSSGAFSGKLILKGTNYSFSGQFHPTGTAQVTISRPSLPSLKVNLLLDFAGGVSGTVNEGSTWTAQFTGNRRTSSTVPAKFTLLIPRSDSSTTAPGGFGFATMVRNSSGSLHIQGTLADGTTFSQSTTVSSDGQWPLFASLYRGKGLLHGEMLFLDDPSYDVYGENFIWLKATNAIGKFYTNGFALTGPVVGSTYVHAQALTWTSGFLEFGGGNLVSPTTNQVTVGSGNKLLISGANKPSLSLGSSGLLRGNFVHPNIGNITPLRGVFLQKPQFGAGFFLGSSQSGYFMLQAAP